MRSRWSIHNAIVDNVNGRLYIPLCYDNDATRAQVHQYMQAATKSWEDALGCFRGIQFYIRNHNCNSPREVNIRMNPDLSDTAGQSYSALRWNRPNMMLPALHHFPHPNGYTYIAMLVHELGTQLNPSVLMDLELMCVMQVMSSVYCTNISALTQLGTGSRSTATESLATPPCTRMSRLSSRGGQQAQHSQVA